MVKMIYTCNGKQILYLQEISHKSDKITQLEQEKAQLIRDLFEARSSHKTNYDDTTFM